MDFSLTDEQNEVGHYFWEFAQAHILPIRDRLETDLSLRRALFQQMAKEGFFVLNVSPKWGGRQTDALSYSLALAAISKADAGVGVAMSVNNWVAEALALYGTALQRENYLSKLITGEWSAASFALTEKQAGSDPKNIQTTAHSVEGGYLIQGEKQFITNGDLADIAIVFVKKENRFACFIVDRSIPGWGVQKVERKMGLLTVNLVDLFFDRCLVPRENLLGEEGEGLHIALAMLDRGRLGIAAQAIGIAEAAYEAALSYAQERCTFGKQLTEHQAIAFKLADMRVKLDAAKLLLYKADWLRDRGETFTLEASIAKLYASEACNQIADEALQIHGGYGYVKDFPLERYYRDARVTTIYEGTSEIQRLLIGRLL